MAPPKIIYLQYFDEDGELDPSADEITWCRDRINETDLVYILRTAPTRQNPAQQSVWADREKCPNCVTGYYKNYQVCDVCGHEIHPPLTQTRSAGA